MLRSALSCLALVLLASCGPKKVESPLEKAPPAEIAQARVLASSGDVRGAQNAYETFIINHPGTAEADLARLELGVLGADVGRCQSAVPHFEQAQDSPDRAIALRASLHLAACQLQLGDPERALQTIEPVAGERFSSEEQALLWDTTVIAAEQTTSAAIALRVLDGLVERGGAPPDPLRVDAVLDLLVQKLTIEEAAALFEELRAGALPQVAVSMRLLNHALDTQDADWVVRASDALRASASIEDPEVTILVARGDEFLHGNPYVVGALLPLSGRGREVGRQLLQGMQLAALDEGGPELVVEDTAGDPSTATAAVDSLIGDQRVVALDHIKIKRAHMGDILIAHRGIDYGKQVIACVGDDQIIHDPAFGIGEEGIARFARWQGLQAGRHQHFQLFSGVIPAQLDLPHMRDVKQCGLFAALLMLGGHASRIVHWHHPAGEINHFAAKFDMQVI